MGNRRMCSLKIIDTDNFLDMPNSTQALYFHLIMRADDDGFISSPKKITKVVNCGDDDLKLLIAKQYLIPFKNGVCVVTHWHIHNYIQKDRYQATIYVSEYQKLNVSEGNVYTLDTECIQDDSDSDTQVKLSKDKLNKVKLIESEENVPPDGVPSRKKTTNPKHKHGMYNNVLFTDEELTKLKEEYPNDWSDRIERLSEYIASTGKSYKSHLATIRAWARNEKSNKSESPDYSDTNRYKNLKME